MRRKIHGRMSREISKSLGFEVAEGDVDVGKTGIEDSTPIVALAAGAAARFRSTLALDATGGIGQSVQPGDRDTFAADLALAVAASFDANKRPLDVGELAAFDFGEL